MTNHNFDLFDLLMLIPLKGFFIVKQHVFI